jgi:hypothetical protein
VDTLIVDYSKLKEKVFSNRMGKDIVIICMEEALVP